MPKYCKADGCTKRANFGLLTDAQPSYCKTHKSNNMLNIVSKKCKSNGCGIQAYFGLPTDKSATYCNDHKLEGMVDIKNKKCKSNGCGSSSPSFGYPDDTRGTYCGAHKLDGMVNIESKKCKSDGCISSSPSFGYPDDQNGTYCGSHKLDGMVDITHKKCIRDGCITQAYFGLSTDKSPTYCYDHKSNAMIDIKNKKCKADGCITQAYFGLSTDKNATYCETHKSKNMVDIKNKRCDTCKITQMNQKYKPNCAACHFSLHPNDPRIRNYKTKEQAYMSGLLKKFSQFKLDKTINGGCSKRRPDGFLDLLTHIIIIEIDENEHKSYDDTCNNRRTMELSQDVDHRPIVFIRLNPDGYTLNDKRMKGSFSLTKKTGELKVSKKEFNKRLNSLIESVDHHMIHIPDKTILIEYLYFTQ